MAQTLGEFLPALPTYVLNLPRRRDKWDALCIELQAAGIGNVRHVPGIDGLDLPAKDVEAYAPTLGVRDRPYAAGKLGCVLGHINAADTMLAVDRFPCLFLQDDAQFVLRPSWRIETVPDVWDLLILGGHAPNGKLDDGWHRVTAWYCMHALVIGNRAVAEALRAAWMQRDGPADHAWWQVLKTFDAKVCRPSAVFQRGGISDIEQRRRPRRQ